MSKVELDQITSGYNLSKINDNFQRLEDELNNKVLYRKIVAGEQNSMSNNLDMNSKDILNAQTVTTNILNTTTLTIGGIPVIPGNVIINPSNSTREALRRSYAYAGYTLIPGSFEVGGVLTSSTDVLLREVTGIAYSGSGPFPQFVGPNTNPAVGGFTDRSRELSVIVFDLVHYGVVADGVAPATNAPLGTPATGTDNTAAFQACLAAAQSLVSSGIAQGSIDPSIEVLITTSRKGKYLIAGTNPLGWQFAAGAQTANVKMKVDLRGSSLLWNVPVGGVFIDNAYALYAPKFENFSLFLFGFTGKRGIFFRTNNNPSSTFNPLQMPLFDRLQVRGGSTANENRPATLGNHFDTIFQINAGNNLCDRGVMTNCFFGQWNIFFSSANNEAVSWTTTSGTTLQSHVDGATLAVWTVPWSGDQRFVDCTVLMKGPNQTIVKSIGFASPSPIPYNDGEILFDCRMETNSAGVKLFEGTHGVVRFRGLNFAAGSSSPATNTIGDVLGSASLEFESCLNVPTKVKTTAFLGSEIFPARNAVFIDGNCTLAGGHLVITDVLTWASGSPMEYITAINSGYFIRTIKCEAVNAFIADRPPLVRQTFDFYTKLYGYQTVGGNSVVNNDVNSYSIAVPPLMMMDKIEVYVAAVSAATADSIGVYLGSTLIHTITISAGAPTRVSGLPSGQAITNSSESPVALSFRARLAGTDVAGSTILFRALCRTRGFIDKNDIDVGGAVVLKSDRMPNW